MAWLRALSQPIPQAWELREEHEANAAAGEVDLVLDEKLDDANFEAEETSFAAELMTMPAFSADRDDEEEHIIGVAIVGRTKTTRHGQ